MDDGRNSEKLREIAKSLRMDDAWNEANWLDAAADEIARLRAALEPFANVPTHGLDGGPLACASIGYEDGGEGTDLPHSPTWRGRLPHEAFTAARRALGRDI